MNFVPRLKSLGLTLSQPAALSIAARGEPSGFVKYEIFIEASSANIRSMKVKFIAYKRQDLPVQLDLKLSSVGPHFPSL